MVGSRRRRRGGRCKDDVIGSLKSVVAHANGTNAINHCNNTNHWMNKIFYSL